jgi:CubicO group peptidase (beta-lactamase class C family)
MHLDPRALFAVLGLLLAAPAAADGPPALAVKSYLGDPQFPDDVWTASTPEEQGLDGAKLEAAVSAARERGHALHAFLVIRHGKLVLERYGVVEGRQLTPADPHPLYSVTKTFTSMLVGLAIADGKIASVEARVSPFFPEPELRQANVEKEGLNVEDLLTMQSGIAYSEGNDEALFQAPSIAAAYWVRPLVWDVGVQWNYSSGDSQLLAEIVRRATGRTPLEYAQARILGPLGITAVRWDADGGGTHLGGRGLALRPRDLARFGWMLLSGGRWKGAQVVPSEWIAAATRPVVKIPLPMGRYGYQCWVPRFGGFVARGWQGQELYVFPDQDLVVVFNAALPGRDADVALDALVTEFVLPALRG